MDALNSLANKLNNSPWVQFKKLHPSAQLPRCQTSLASGADLSSREDIFFEPFERQLVRTGIAIESVEDCPLALDLQLRARSSLGLKKGLILTNGVGTIDLDYRDEICLPLINLSQETQEIRQGERIGQLVLGILLPWKNSEPAQLRQGGFGSTGA